VKQFDVLSVGETLVDFISEEEQGALMVPRRFVMYPGGQATNVALNVSRLGGVAAIVGCVGDDPLGVFLHHHLAVAGVETAYLKIMPHIPTTLAVVTRHRATPDFAIYRGADAQLVASDMPLSCLPTTSLVHTSAFALSREPSCSTILDFVVQAHTAGCLVSFDPNYHPRLWEIDASPLAMLERIYPYVFLTKPSLDDCIRLFGDGQTPESYAAHFLRWGVKEVVLTMGSAGVLHANAGGTSFYSMRQVEVIDVTGAGDSFWSGLLLATLDGYAMADAIRFAQAVAEIKLQQVGPLAQSIDRVGLYTSLGLKKIDSTEEVSS
jgi:sugar/nucleoside kinase (ribokinase family)